MFVAFPFRKTGVHPGSGPGQAFSGKCSNERFIGAAGSPCSKAAVHLAGLRPGESALVADIA
ncbi:MAG: hypothetical protein ABSG76_13725, partial [Xanthobacteraceae bacterium]